jgi:hypothetical protein
MLPSLFVLIDKYINSNLSDLSQLYRSGECFLYAVSFLGSAFLVYNHFKIRKSDLLTFFSFTTVILVIIASYFYAVLSKSDTPDLNAIKVSSIIALVISIPLFFYSQVVNNKHSPDIGEQRRNEQEQIQNGIG